MTRYPGTETPSIDGTGKSSWFLVRVKTPSTEHWDIARYDYNYRKERPWRTEHNHGIEIIYYYDLPEATHDQILA